MTEPRYRPENGCAFTALRRGDVLAATAPPAERWLLIECREAWPRDALTALKRSDGGDLAGEISRRCAAVHARPVLVRRSGRTDQATPRRWALVDSRPGHEAIRWGDLPSDDHVLDVLDGSDPGTPSTEPVYLVCTHGRHDACCAVWGRPVASALAAVHPDRTWECSHVGGDRFAPNLVILPHGLFYGHLPPARVLEPAERYDEGLVVPDLFRGAGAVAAPVQAAQQFAREAGWSLSIDALQPVSFAALAPDRWRVVLDDGGAEVEVVVAAHVVTVDGAMTCASKPPGRVRQFELVSLTAGPGSRSPASPA